MNHPKQLLTNNMPTYNVKTTNGRHHHHVAVTARISLILSCYSSLSSIAPGSSSSLYRHRLAVLDGHPAFSRPCEEVHRSISLMSSSLLLQQNPTCLVRLSWIVFVMGGRCPHSCCFMGCCFQDLFNIARNIFV